MPVIGPRLGIHVGEQLIDDRLVARDERESILGIQSSDNPYRGSTEPSVACVDQCWSDRFHAHSGNRSDERVRATPDGSRPDHQYPMKAGPAGPR